MISQVSQYEKAVNFTQKMPYNMGSQFKYN